MFREKGVFENQTLYRCSNFCMFAKWKYTHQGWKAFLRNNNLPPIPVDPENFLDRFRPDLSRVIEVLIC